MDEHPSAAPDQPDLASARTSDLRRIALPVSGIFCILLLHTLIFASDFLIPLTAAFLGYFVLNRPRRALERVGVPAFVSALLFTAALSVVIVILLVRLSEPAAQFIDDLPSLIRQINMRLQEAGGTLEAINDAAIAAEEVVADQGEPRMEVEVVSDAGVVETLFSTAPAYVSRILFALILLFFLVASGDLFLVKIVQSMDRLHDKRRAVEVLHSMEDRLGYYLGGITIINICLGICVGIAMALWGVPGAMILGFMAFCLNFVPVLGGLLGALIAAAITFVSMDATWITFGVFTTYIALTSIEGQVVTPMVISRRMRLNTTVVFLTVAFFAWIWSVMGMVVALPILIVLKIVCDEIPSLQTLGRFLGDLEGDQSSKLSRAAVGPPVTRA